MISLFYEIQNNWIRAYNEIRGVPRSPLILKLREKERNGGGKEKDEKEK